MNWLHFIGRSYYTPEKFIAEAQRVGVNRRIALRLLGAFNWGDRVFLAFGDFRTKRRKNPTNKSIVIGYFEVESIGGLTPDAAQLIADIYSGEIHYYGSARRVERECGEYYSIGYIIVPDVPSLKEIVELLARWHITELPGLGIQGRFVPINPPVEIDLGFRFGYTKIDEKKVPELAPYLKKEYQTATTGTGEIFDKYALKDLWGSGKTAW